MNSIHICRVCQEKSFSELLSDQSDSQKQIEISLIHEIFTKKKISNTRKYVVLEIRQLLKSFEENIWCLSL